MQKIKVKLWNDWPISFSYWRKLNHAKKIQKKPLLLVLKAKNNWKQKPVESSSWESFNFPCILTMSSSLNLYHDPDYWYKTLCYITVILRQNLQLNTNQLLVTLLSHVYQWCCNITSTVVPVLEITAPYRSVLESMIIWRLRACLHWHYNTSLQEVWQTTHRPCTWSLHSLSEILMSAIHAAVLDDLQKDLQTFLSLMCAT